MCSTRRGGLRAQLSQHKRIAATPDREETKRGAESALRTHTYRTAAGVTESRKRGDGSHAMATALHAEE